LTPASISAAESDGSRRFPHQDVAFPLRLVSTPDVANGVRVRKVLFDLSQPPAISGLRADGLEDGMRRTEFEDSTLSS
jgi:hypothetical protein